jgi:hypothetical protein
LACEKSYVEEAVSLEENPATYLKINEKHTMSFISYRGQFERDLQ